MPLFTLEAIRAKHGDSLILHYGKEDEPRFILIDGGPPTVYRTFLRPRLAEIKDHWYPEEPLPLEMLMVSHIDADHIAGILDLTKELIEKEDNPLCDIAVLWHNSFDEVVGNRKKDLFSELPKEVVTAGLEDVLPEGFKPEDRPYHPHVTLARCPDPWRRDAIDKFKTALTGPVGPPFVADHGILFESKLSPKGARYRAVETFPMGKDEP